MAHIKDVKIGSNTYLIEPTVYAATAGSASAMTAAVSNFALDTGVIVTLKITTTNAANATLSVNGTDAKNIRYKNANIAANALSANRFYSFVYDGAYWQLIGELDTTYDDVTTSTHGLMSTADKTKLDTLKDAPFIMGTQTQNTSQWKGVASTLTNLVNGQTIYYYLPYNTSSTDYSSDTFNGITTSGVALNLTLADSNETGPLPVFYQGMIRVTSQYMSGALLVLTYIENAQLNGSTIGSGWRVHAQYNTDTTTQLKWDNATIIAGTAGIFPRTLIMMNSDGRYESIVTSASTSNSKTKNTAGFLPHTLLYYSGTQTITNGNSISSAGSILQAFPSLDFRYSANTSSTPLTSNKPVFLIGTIGDNGAFYLEDTWWTQDLPNSDDGKAYMYIGIACGISPTTSTDNITLNTNHPIFMYKNNGIREISTYAIDASKVNGHTVGKDVPVDAVFNYTFSAGPNSNQFTATPSSGTAQTVTITPSIANNITGTGTSGYLAKFNGTNTITNGPQLGSDTTKFLDNTGAWANLALSNLTNADNLKNIEEASSNGYGILKKNSNGWELLATNNTHDYKFLRQDGTWAESILNYGYGYRNGSQTKKYFEVLTFTQKVDTDIGTRILLLISKYFAAENTGILSIQCQWKKQTTTPNKYQGEWIINTLEDSNTDNFILTYKYNDTTQTVILKLYAYINSSTWASYHIVKLSEHGFGAHKDQWELNFATDNFAYEDLPSDETQINITYSTIKNATSYVKGQIGTSTARTDAPNPGEIQYLYNVNKNYTGFSAVNNANSIITLNNYISDANYCSQLGVSSNGNLYYRSFSGKALDTTTTWKQIAFTDGTIANATNLVNAPSLAVSNTTQITVTAGGKTSDAFTVPFATSATSATSANKLATIQITSENDIPFEVNPDGSTATYKGSGNTWTGDIASMQYAGILHVANDNRSWEIWAQRESSPTAAYPHSPLHWRNRLVGGQDQPTGWAPESIIPDIDTTNNSNGNLGTASQPIYAKGGRLLPCTYTLNVASSENTTSKIYLIGAASQIAYATTNSDLHVYATNGALSVGSLKLNANTDEEKVNIEYNTTSECITFSFE